ASEEKAAREHADDEKRAAQHQEQRAETALHAMQLDLALRAWERHDVVEAERVLGEGNVSFQQTWEQRHLRSLCRRKALPLRLGHIGYVGSVAFSGDGRRLASGGGWDGTIRVWDVQTGENKIVIPGSAVRCVAFSGDGKRIASGSSDQTVKVWDAQ